MFDLLSGAAGLLSACDAGLRAGATGAEYEETMNAYPLGTEAFVGGLTAADIPAELRSAAPKL